MKAGGSGPSVKENTSRGQSAVATGVSATSSTLATAAGLTAYAHGGNAIDAAIASSFALFVVEPDMSHLAGQAHVLVHLANSAQSHHIDAYSTAPAAAHPGMYEWLEQPTQGEYRYHTKDGLNDTGPLSVAVPATLPGLERLHHMGAALPWSDLLRPAIELADKGFRIGQALAGNLEAEWGRLARCEEFRKVYGEADQPLTLGALLKQPELAETLRWVARRGAGVLTDGPLAVQMVDELTAQGGVISGADLEEGLRHVTAAPPLEGEYFGHTVHTAGPSTAGGQLLLMMLAHHERSRGGRSGVEGSGIGTSGAGKKSDTLDRLVAMQHAFAHRLAINVAASGASAGQVRFDAKDLWRENNTTHHSHMDEAGNAVAVTQSIGDSFGSGVILKGTGILLNNAMKLFDPRPDRPNSIQPGRKVVSTMTPTVLLLSNRAVLALGSPSGTRIVNAVFQALADLVPDGKSFSDSVKAPRLHWNGDELEIESDHPEIELLDRSVGRMIRREPQDPWFGQVQLAGRAGLRPDGPLTCCTDPRRPSAGGALSGDTALPSDERGQEE